MTWSSCLQVGAADARESRRRRNVDHQEMRLQPPFQPGPPSLHKLLRQLPPPPRPRMLLARYLLHARLASPFPHTNNTQPHPQPRKHVHPFLAPFSPNFPSYNATQGPQAALPAGTATPHPHSTTSRRKPAGCWRSWGSAAAPALHNTHRTSSQFRHGSGRRVAAGGMQNSEPAGSQPAQCLSRCRLEARSF